MQFFSHFKADRNALSQSVRKGSKLAMCSAFLAALVISNLLFNSNSGHVAIAAGPEVINKNSPSSRINVSESISNGLPPLDFIEEIDKPARKPESVLGRLYPNPNLEQVRFKIRDANTIELLDAPKFKTTLNGKLASMGQKDEFVFYTLDPELQKYTQELVSQSDAAHIAVVAMEPTTGKILAIAEKSVSVPYLSLHSGFPAASLFKVVTAAAAVEKEAVMPASLINFRGGNYTLNKWNFSPDKRKDKRYMTVAEAMGKSVNPVFGRIALNYLSPTLLRRYVQSFGFNSSLDFELPLTKSAAVIPEDDYGLSRTAAGFGEVHISPVHAAAMMSGIANGGVLPRPRLVQQVISDEGQIIYQAKPEGIKRIVSPTTSATIMRMMLATTTIGTSMKEFMLKKKPVLPVSVAAKTGTLSGTNPVGLNHWFIAAAPAENPKIALAVIVVSAPKRRTTAKASRVGRQVIQKYLF